jgi:cell pole-organizing protein PopZ
MAKLAQAQEPSMEEILASIRRIITEDEVGGERPAAERAPAAKPPRRAEPAPPPVHVPQRQDDPHEESEPEESGDVLELSEAQMTAVQPVNSANGAMEDDFDEPAPAVNGSPARGIVAREELSGSSLLSPNADATVTSAFSTLANTILSNEARTLEDIVREMLRPMLKAWLDDNLPPLVERMVRDEIERVSRGRR